MCVYLCVYIHRCFIEQSECMYAYKENTDKDEEGSMAWFKRAEFSPRKSTLLNNVPCFFGTLQYLFKTSLNTAFFLLFF